LKSLKVRKIIVTPDEYSISTLLEIIRNSRQRCFNEFDEFVMSMCQIGEAIGERANQAAIEQPGLFDDYVAATNGRQELIDSIEYESQHPSEYTTTSNPVTDLFDSLSNLVDAAYEITNGTPLSRGAKFTARFFDLPFGALQQANEDIRNATTAASEIAHVPIQGDIAVDVYNHDRDKPGFPPPSPFPPPEDDDKPTYPPEEEEEEPEDECQCKSDLQDWADEFVDDTKLDMIEAANEYAMNMAESFANQMGHNWDPTQVGAVVNDIKNSLLSGLEQGFVNSIMNMIRTATSSLESVSGKCSQTGENMIPEELSEAAAKMSELG
jgi:hypothetical protein